MTPINPMKNPMLQEAKRRETRRHVPGLVWVLVALALLFCSSFAIQSDRECGVINATSIIRK